MGLGWQCFDRNIKNLGNVTKDQQIRLSSELELHCEAAFLLWCDSSLCDVEM